MKNLVKAVALAVLIICIVAFFKAVIFGVAIGALGTIIYFSLTGSTLNWRKPKK